MPTLRRAEPDSGSLARSTSRAPSSTSAPSTSRTSTTRSAALTSLRKAEPDTSRSSSLRAPETSSRGTTPGSTVRKADDTARSSSLRNTTSGTATNRTPGVIRERSTISASNVRSAERTATSVAPRSQPVETGSRNLGPTSYWAGTWRNYNYHPHHYNGWGSHGWPYYNHCGWGGFSIGFRIGGFGLWFGRSFGFGFGWPVYHGSFQSAYYMGPGRGYWLTPHSYWGWGGWRYGSHRHWYNWTHWRSHHWFSHNNCYWRIRRPYWYGYSNWYSWRPYRYSYVSLVYDSLDDGRSYSDGWEDGYDRGYNRGYEDGGEDAGALRDDRRRDRIGADRTKRPEPELDRNRTDAATEYRYEMQRGVDAVGKGDYATATKAFKEAVILDPQSADARYSLAVSAMAEGKFAFSAFALRRGVNIDLEAGNIDLAKAFGGEVQLDALVAGIDNELATSPTDADLLLLRGYISLRRGDASGAAETLDRALSANPQDKAAKTLHKQAMDALERE